MLKNEVSILEAGFTVRVVPLDSPEATVNTPEELIDVPEPPPVTVHVMPLGSVAGLMLMPLALNAWVAPARTDAVDGVTLKVPVTENCFVTCT
ncbi:hypothetical protein, partial [Treponema sp. R6D11]